MKRFFARLGRFFWSWGVLKFVLLSVTLVIFLYAEEDWRGARAWAATKAKWEAKGESFDFSKFIPTPVPDDQNLAAIPLFMMEPDSEDSKLLFPVKLQDALTESKHGGELPVLAHKENLRAGVAAAYAGAFKNQIPPADSLTQLESLYPIINDLRQASAMRPYCRFNLDYNSSPWAHSFALLTFQIKVSKLLCLHALFALQENQPSVALDDIKIGFKLAKGISRDPTIVAGLVSVAGVAIIRMAVDEGLKDHVWNDAQLADLQDELGGIDFLAQYQSMLRGELATETMPNLNLIKKVLSTAKDPFSFYGVWPGGWLDLDKSRVVDFIFSELQCSDARAHRVLPEISRALEQEADRANALPWRLAPWNFFFAVTGPPFTHLALHFAQIQVSLDEDRIVCALERYRLAHGTYPPSLDVISPLYIEAVPHDVVGGRPYRYQLRPDGTFLLYSVGWNQTDDDGKVVLKKDMPASVDYEQGDWAWPTSKS